MKFINEIRNGKRHINPSIVKSTRTLIVVLSIAMMLVLTAYVGGIDIL